MKKNKNILEFCLSPDLGGLELFMVNCYKDFKTKTNCKIVVQKEKKLDRYLENEDVFQLLNSQSLLILSTAE
jgi:hypothetical protein